MEHIKIVETTNVHKFANDINEYQKLGYKLYGFPTVNIKEAPPRLPSTFSYFQMMIMKIKQT